MERRDFVKALLATPMLSAAVKDDIKADIKEKGKPEFVMAMLSDTNSGTYPRRRGDKVWVYLIPESIWAVLEDGRFISKRDITIIGPVK